MGLVSKVLGLLRILFGAFISIEEHLQSSKEDLQLTSIKGGHILSWRVCLATLMKWLEEVEASQTKWDT